MSGVKGVSARLGAGVGKERVEKKSAHDSDLYPSDTIRVYFNGIRKFPLLSATEEKSLARLVTRGDPKARRRMIESNLRLVVISRRGTRTEGSLSRTLLRRGTWGL